MAWYLPNPKPSGRLEQSGRGGASTLVISPVIETDTGDYECWADSQGESGAQVKKTLKVLIEPRRGSCQPGQYQVTTGSVLCTSHLYRTTVVYCSARARTSTASPRGTGATATTTARAGTTRRRCCAATSPARGRSLAPSSTFAVSTLQRWLLLYCRKHLPACDCAVLLRPRDRPGLHLHVPVLRGGHGVQRPIQAGSAGTSVNCTVYSAYS